MLTCWIDLYVNQWQTGKVNLRLIAVIFHNTFSFGVGLVWVEGHGRT